MDINTLREIAVVLGALAFLGVCWWAFSPKRKKRFEEDAMLPFADEEKSERAARLAGRKKDESSTEDTGVAERTDGPSAAKRKGQDEQ
ncbi:cbb3-type cytochrome c oxidase subunit 3 [Microbulbifer magnicolonia]|uniref:cbb3-type cytochrome oxidase subunit 3 n=1 Tax=Microbulbifer magnicolonia TaxID=3109744 RepID=UPI002B40A8BC|nr:cbb3-type cytochrome c oxidase subunit 3 [Microbulbifer sp. GG15]